MTQNTDYGSKYYVVETSKNGWISLFAERFDISAAGDLIFYNKMKNTEKEIPGFAICKGNWTNCFAASVIDGSPITIDTWEKDD